MESSTERDTRWSKHARPTCSLPMSAHHAGTSPEIIVPWEPLLPAQQTASPLDSSQTNGAAISRAGHKNAKGCQASPLGWKQKIMKLILVYISLPKKT